MRKAMVLAGLVSSLFALSACGPQIRYSATQPAPGPMKPRPVEQVEIYRELPPERAFAEVGVFSTRSDGDDKEEVQAIRKRAAKMGCDAIVVGGGGDDAVDDDIDAKPKKKSAPMLRVTCVVWTAEEKPAAEPKPPKPAEPSEPKPAEPAKTEPVATEKPDGAGGFLFGQSVDEVQNGCKDLKRRWKQIKGGRYTCYLNTRTPDVPSMFRLGFCGGRLCEITLETDRTDSGQTWQDQFQKARDPLVQKYGEPKKAESELPDGCSGDGLNACIVDGRAKLSNQWWWASGERIVEKLAPDEKGKNVVLQIVHSKWPLEPPAAAPAQPPAAGDAGG